VERKRRTGIITLRSWEKAGGGECVTTAKKKGSWGRQKRAYVITGGDKDGRTGSQRDPSYPSGVVSEAKTQKKLVGRSGWDETKKEKAVEKSKGGLRQFQKTAEE